MPCPSISFCLAWYVSVIALTHSHLTQGVLCSRLAHTVQNLWLPSAWLFHYSTDRLGDWLRGAQLPPPELPVWNVIPARHQSASSGVGVVAGKVSPRNFAALCICLQPRVEESRLEEIGKVWHARIWPGKNSTASWPALIDSLYNGWFLWLSQKWIWLGTLAFKA